LEVRIVFDALLLLGQALAPVCIALAYLALCLFVLFRRRLSSDALPRLFLAYLLLTSVWNVGLVLAIVDDVPVVLPDLTWTQLAFYGLILLGVLYWSLTRAFLQRTCVAPWAWGIGLAGLCLAVGLDTRWISWPTDIPALGSWSYGWLNTSCLLYTSPSPRD